MILYARTKIVPEPESNKTVLVIMKRVAVLLLSSMSVQWLGASIDNALTDYLSFMMK